MAYKYQSPKKQRTDLNYRRNKKHPFVAQKGHPTLCAACNATVDEEIRGARIHTERF